jgi:hypothetical protein
MPYRSKCLLAALAVLGIGTALTVHAQQDPAVRPTPGKRPAAEVLSELGRSAGVIVLADASVQGRLATPPGGATPQTIEQQIADLVRVLPAGATWAKLYVPAPASGRWDTEVVADFARVQARLLGTTVGRPGPPDIVEVLGQRMPATRTNEHITALNLKLVYLVTNPQARAEALALVDRYGKTLEQREQYAKQEEARILALDPARRIRILTRMMASPNETPEQALIDYVFQHLSPDELGQLRETTHREAIDRERVRKGLDGGN